jgi:multidrug efflux pump subunit AcrB
LVNVQGEDVVSGIYTPMPVDGEQVFVVVMCGVGIIALAGIIVNNNILLLVHQPRTKRSNYLQKQ